jgi:succinate dehydrogenase / fumarate reductase cytochrome b subunit
MPNHPAPRNLWRWFDPRNRQIGYWAFILNRITALGLTLYLTLHLVALSQLAQGAGAYNSFVALAKNPVFKVGEMLVVAAGIIHGLNGIRIALNSFDSDGIGVDRHRLVRFHHVFRRVGGSNERGTQLRVRENLSSKT